MPPVAQFVCLNLATAVAGFCCGRFLKGSPRRRFGYALLAWVGLIEVYILIGGMPL